MQRPRGLPIDMLHKGALLIGLPRPVVSDDVAIPSAGLSQFDAVAALPWLVRRQRPVPVRLCAVERDIARPESRPVISPSPTRCLRASMRRVSRQP